MSLEDIPLVPPFPRQATLEAVLEHAHAEGPREACGVIVNDRGHERYVPCRNLATDSEHFIIDPDDYVKAEEDAEILAIVHSHPYASPQPSQGDLVGCERSGLPWLIVSVPNDTFHVFRPSGYVAPLTGREFVHGLLDCCTLLQDWFLGEHGIVLPARPPESLRANWWKRGPNGEPPPDLYMQAMPAAGFEPINTLAKRGDVALIQLNADVANHCAIYMGDQTILHHIWGRLSCREIWGGYWLKHARGFWRHQQL